MSSQTSAMTRSRVKRLRQRFYYDRENWILGDPRFVCLVTSFLTLYSIVLDVGAGRDSIHRYSDTVQQVIGIDVSEEVKSNSYVHEAYVCDVVKMPFPDGFFDVVFADYVVEHLEDPVRAFCEVRRVLRPGGVFVIRTPNRYHYVPILSAMLPHSIHVCLRQMLQAISEADTFPTFYRCNGVRALRRTGRQARLEVARPDLVEKEPSYLMWSVPSFLFGFTYERMVNRFGALAPLRGNIFAVCRRLLDSHAR